MAKEKKIVVPVEKPVVAPTTKVDFDAWFAMREKKIPIQHRKEIIKADFKGRGLKMFEEVAVYDEALKKYGVILK